MMRLVFLLAAEERGLLPHDNALYSQFYAVSTLRDQLQDVADKQGEEVLDRRYEAWCRLLATFRAVHGGVRHEDLALPAYGGSLFDPDRFPFLEGRAAGSSWKDGGGGGGAAAVPLAVDDRTVLHLLRSLQLLEVRAGGGHAEARRLSFRALGVEQIGHVYEGLLDHTAKRARGLVLSLDGRLEPELDVATLEKKRAEGDEALVRFVAEETGRTEKAVAKALTTYVIPKDDARKLLVVCENREQLYQRTVPYAGLVRKDPSGNPVVIHEGGIYVTEGAERRATGTHYTPRSLTEPIVQHTLDPLVYVGPAEGGGARGVEAAVATGDPGVAGVRPGDGVGRVFGAGVPVFERAAGGGVGGRRERGWGAAGDHAGGGPGEGRGGGAGARRGCGGAADAGEEICGGSVSVWGRQEPDGRRDGEAVAVADDAAEG
jgi:hypothetical protein